MKDTIIVKFKKTYINYTLRGIEKTKLIKYSTSKISISDITTIDINNRIVDPRGDTAAIPAKVRFNTDLNFISETNFNIENKKQFLEYKNSFTIGFDLLREDNLEERIRKAFFHLQSFYSKKTAPKETF